LQSAGKLIDALRSFSATEQVEAFEERTPICTLSVARAVEGIQISDGNLRVALTPREANKWADLLDAEIARLNVRTYERGQIRTVFVDDGEGRWVLQWGDQVFVPAEALSEGLTPAESRSEFPLINRSGDFIVLLSADSCCVALTSSEAMALSGAI
jgi:hypothetical protein